MPSVDPNLVPCVNPGSVFFTLTTNDTLLVRWVEARDPHYFDTYNRPMADLLLRQLIIAKSLDQVGLRLSHQSVFPFLVPCTLDVDTSTVGLPVSWIWDSHVSVPDVWGCSATCQNPGLRLIQILRRGTNDPTSSEFTGTMRLVFGGVREGGSELTAIYYADYVVDSSLSFQIVPVVDATESNVLFSPTVDGSEHELTTGYVVFRTLDQVVESDFFESVAPNITSDEWAVYEVSDTPPGGSSVDGDFAFASVEHGTGVLVPSAYNLVTPVGVDEAAVLGAINYPWRVGTNLTSINSTTGDNITIPSGLFSQFMIQAPYGDRDCQTNEDNFPVICTRIRRLDANANDLQFFFSTYNAIVGSTSTQLIDFATLTLNRNNLRGDLIEIVPQNNLLNNSDPEWQNFHQEFGSGFVILSGLWDSSTTIDGFFDSFLGVLDEPADRNYEAVLNEFAVHRTPRTVQTIGQALAAQGSTARLLDPIHPSDTNRNVMEADQGEGDVVDFIQEGFDENPDICNTGNTGSLAHRIVTLKINSSNDTNFTYDDDILPRLKRLFGRDPIFGDEWYDGTVFKKFNGETWLG